MKKKWDYEKCKLAAKECKTYREFCLKFPQAYYISNKNGWDFIERKNKKPKYWDYEKCKNEAIKYNNTTEFMNNCPSGYDAARKHGWIWDWFKRKVHGRNYWTYERCFEEAKKYSTYSSFRDNSYQCYFKCKNKTNWISEFKWLKNDLKLYDEEVKKYLIYKYSFDETNSVYVGLTCNLKERDRNHRRIRRRNGKEYKGAVKFHSYINNIKIPKPIVIENNLNAKEAKIREEYWVSYFRKNGFNILNIAKTGEKSSSIGGSKRKWNYETVYNEAKKYTSRTEFQKKSASAYNSSVRNGWINDYEWLKPKIHPNGYWTYERCFEEAKKYSKVSEFMRNNGSAYVAARKNKWLNDLKNNLWVR